MQYYVGLSKWNVIQILKSSLHLENARRDKKEITANEIYSDTYKKALPQRHFIFSFYHVWPSYYLHALSESKQKEKIMIP